MANTKIFKPKYVSNILVSKDKIEKGIKLAAKWADKKFAKAKKFPVFVCLLRGAIPFYTKLIMNLNIDVITDYMIVSCFAGKITCQSEPKIVTNIMTDVKGRDVVICDDVCDTARTLKLLKQYMIKKGAKSVTVMVLADKPAGRKVKFEPDYKCFTIKGKPFLIGYGLDVAEIARNVPYLAEFDTKYLKEIEAK